jgi:hypothetical protein
MISHILFAIPVFFAGYYMGYYSGSKKYILGMRDGIKHILNNVVTLLKRKGVTETHSAQFLIELKKQINETD